MLKRICAVDGCPRAARCRGWCNTHYERWRRTGSTADPERHEHCTIAGCGRPYYGSGWCSLHYKRWYKHGDPLATPRAGETSAQRLARWAPPGRPDECWPWTGSTDGEGYGLIAVNGRSRRANRVAWSQHNGPIPTGAVIRHTCDNPPCVNPAHLLMGTQADNIADAIERKRWIHGQRHPRAKLTTGQVQEIRAALAAGTSPTELSRRYPVSLAHICRIRDEQSRKHG